MYRRSGRAISISRPKGISPRWTIAVAMAAGLLLAVPTTGHATDAVDQSLPAGSIPTVINSTKVMAQTFTAGTTGQIDKLSLSLESHSNLVTGWLEIRPVDAAGVPTGGTTQPTSTPIQINFPFGNPAHDFTIDPAVPVTAGTKYAIVWTTKIGTAFWWGTSFNSYAAGQQWLACIGCGWTANATKDFGFATWVTTAPIVTNQPATVAADHPDVTVTEAPQRPTPALSPTLTATLSPSPPHPERSPSPVPTAGPGRGTRQPSTREQLRRSPSPRTMETGSPRPPPSR